MAALRYGGPSPRSSGLLAGIRAGPREGERDGEGWCREIKRKWRKKSGGGGLMVEVVHKRTCSGKVKILNTRSTAY